MEPYLLELGADSSRSRIVFSTFRILVRPQTPPKPEVSPSKPKTLCGALGVRPLIPEPDKFETRSFAPKARSGT